MNTKFKMPQFRRTLTWSGMVKELMLTFLGTTLSIVLTFGTAQYFELKQQRDDGRQTAMMVIHDMEISADRFEQYAKREEERYLMTQYVLERLNRLDSIAQDTLSHVYFYITQSNTDDYKFDDSNEKLFLSSQDVWKNINNATFIDVAQRFFYYRRDMYEVLNHFELYIKPIPRTELTQFMKEHNSVQFDFAAYLSERLTRPEVKDYLIGSHQRQHDLTSSRTNIQEFAKRCKFIMDISDEELKEYLDKRKHGGKPLKKNQLIGTWILANDMEQYYEMQFNDDFSFLSTSVYNTRHPYYIGSMSLNISYTGTWNIIGDSLILLYNPGFDYTIDTMQIRCLADKEKEVMEYINNLDKYYKEAKEEAKTDSVQRSSWAAFMNGNGKKAEVWRIDNETGKEKCYYMDKKENDK